MARSGTLTILFTDLVGSTELRARLGDDEADALYREHLLALRRVIGAHRGEEVKNLGDGVMAVFGSARDALDCAVSMQRSTDRDNHRSPEHALGLRVGVSVGEVAEEEGDFFGTAVVEAARLCAAADGGQILVSEVVRLLVGSRAAPDMKPMGALDLKGLPEPFPTCEVVWEPAAVSSIPLPPHFAAEPRLAFVGRTRERAALVDAWKQARSGQRRVLFVAGEPGIGKTRLAAEQAIEAHASGATILYGRCEDGVGLAYRPFVEALRHLLTHTSGDELGSLLEHGGAEVARLLPELAARVPEPSPSHAEPETDRFVLFEAIGEVLSRAAQARPVMLVLDDLHWADEPTLLLLRHLVRSARPMPALLLAMYRDSDLRGSTPLFLVLGELRREPGVERVALRGLDEPDVVALLETVAERELEQDAIAFAGVLRRETGGNPFFIEEFLRHLRDTGALSPTAGWAVGRDAGQLVIPDGVRDVIAQRLLQLSDPANDVLRVASVVGREFDLGVVATATGVDDDTAITALEEAMAAALVDEVAGTVDRFAFSHALVHATLYDNLTNARRLRLHHRVGEAIEQRYGADSGSHVVDLARHFCEAARAGADVAKAFAYAVRSGERARAELAYEDAAVWFERALGFDGERDAELHLALGGARVAMGALDEGVAAYRRAADLARESGDAEHLARAALGVSTPREFGAVDPERLALLEEALGRLPERDSPLRARVLGRLAEEIFLSGEQERWPRLVDDAGGMALRVGDTFALRTALHALSMKADPPATTLDLTAELLRLASGSDERVNVAWAHNYRVWWFLGVGDGQAVDRELPAFVAAAEQLRRPALLARARWTEATIACLRGRFDHSERLAREAYALLSEAHDPNAATFFGYQLWLLRFLQGRVEEVLPMMSVMPPHARNAPLISAAIACSYLDVGRVADAAVEFERLATGEFSRLRPGVNLPSILCLAAEACTGLGDARRARTLHSLLSPFAGRSVLGGPILNWFGAAPYYLGVLASTMGDPDEAVSRLEAALAAHERMEALPWVARTQRQLARALGDRDADGDAERARGLRDHALATTRKLGMRRLEEDLEEDMAALYD